MRTQTRLALPLIVAASLLLSSCMKDKCRRTYTLYKPVFSTTAQVRANMKSNPARAVQQPGKLYIYGNYIFLNEREKGIHIIDNSQPSNLKTIAFIDIPGNLDLAVKGNTLYADSYTDLVAFDISNPLEVIAKKFLSNAFPHRGYYIYNTSNNPDSAKVLTSWEARDTTVECETYNQLFSEFYALSSADKSGSYASPGMGGKGGSMARFTIMNNYLYAVTTSDLNVYNISKPQDPSFNKKTYIGNSFIETIYPFKDRLFIGSNNGLYIYDASNPAAPVKVGQFTHATSCDPVIADDNYAWVTLRSGTACQGFTNQLEIVNITNLSNPSLLKTYSMKSPHGLSKDGNLLFICDGSDGLKIYNAADPNKLKLIKHITNMVTYDVIAWNKKALVVTDDGLYQFDYSNNSNIKLISKITLKK